MADQKNSDKGIGCVMLLLLIGVAVVIYQHCGTTTPSPYAAVSVPPPAPKPHTFAEPGIKVTSILGQSRSKVHALLGKPDSNKEGDSFKKGDVYLVARHYEKGRLIWLSASYIQAGGEAFQAPELLKWLNLDPQSDKVSIGSDVYNVMIGGGFVSLIEARYAAAKARRDAAQAERENAKQLKAAEREAAKRQKELRQSIASNLETGFLKSGMDAYVRVRGNSLVVYGISCNRATLYQLVNGDGEGWFSDIKHASFRQTLKDAGFKYLRCVDPYSGGEGWSEL